MSLVFDIFQGVGVAAAVGVRPFLPGLVAGALAAGDIELTFHHTHFHFLQRPLFLLIMVVGIVVVGLLERRTGGASPDARFARAVQGLLALCALAIGALFFAGELARAHHSLWIGVAAGLICAAIGVAATAPLLGRVRARLDADAAGLLPVLVDGAAALGAALSIVAPPVGIVLLAGLIWLLVAGRGRSEQKYAGLRILR